MELFHHTPTSGLSYARIVYFYGTSDIRDDNRPITGLDVTQGFTLPENWLPVGAIGSEGAAFYQAEECLSANPEGTVEVRKGDLWSAGKILKWSPTREGDPLDLKIRVEKEGKYQVYATFVHTPRSGKAALSMDGGKETDRVADLFTPYHEMLRNYWYGSYDLTAGDHTLTFLSRGRNDQSPGSEIGIDFVWIRPGD